MLKRISVEHLQLGMHLHQLCGSWMSHPFWRASFVLKHTTDIRRILDSGMQEVWIDTDKGLDTDPGQSKEEVEAQIDRDLGTTDSPAAVMPERVSLSEEFQRAAKTCAKAKEAVVSMFQEARMGKAIEAESALALVEEINVSVLRNPRALISIARLKRADDYTWAWSSISRGSRC